MFLWVISIFSHYNVRKEKNDKSTNEPGLSLHTVRVNKVHLLSRVGMVFWRREPSEPVQSISSFTSWTVMIRMQVAQQTFSPVGWSGCCQWKSTRRVQNMASRNPRPLFWTITLPVQKVLKTSDKSGLAKRSWRCLREQRTVVDWLILGEIKGWVNLHSFWIVNGPMNVDAPFLDFTWWGGRAILGRQEQECGGSWRWQNNVPQDDGGFSHVLQ